MVCTEHSGCIARIKSLEARMEHRDKLDEKMYSKINTIMGSMLVAAVGVIGHLLFKVAGGG